ncbi:MAG: dihydrolipoyllysine-residue acetyltransferase [Xanthomonadales bacterium]|nr:dihydrolipoyllysine-residue acetyltransferase [Gammaproteobacteria bacterium]MBT8055151.1 dihydrolipoyllysine-residue acetyltransferase [Gammaproteobacteria bacterium]NNK51745.1 dihydrolipoyllysine-residue acetyltransferase [Xanthomonadales bacterium]
MSNTIEVKVPDIGDFSDIPVIEVLVSEGDRVEKEDGLITLESDKATMEVPSPVDGIVRELKLKLDDTVSEGDLVAILEVSESESEAPAQESEPEPEAKADSDSKAEVEAESESGTEGEPETETETETKETEAPSPVEQKQAAPDAERVSGAAAVDPAKVPYASPVIRRFARELGVDLTRVAGSGNKGRITRNDITEFVKSAINQPAAAAVPGFGGLDLDFPPLPEFDFSRYGDVETKKLSRIQKISARHLHRNWVGIPHVTQHDQADITDMEAFRLANADEAVAQGFKLTPLVFLIKAMVASLKKFPTFNASLDRDGETLVMKKYFNIGIAVDTPDGLVVPVLRDCERKGIMELGAELAEISARAREKKLSPQDIQGGCISISSLGGIGGTGFTPIINAPEVAILGVSRSNMQPVWDGKEFQPRLMLPLSLSYDHRVIDGAAAARFTRFLASRLEDLRRLTL